VRHVGKVDSPGRQHAIGYPQSSEAVELERLRAENARLTQRVRDLETLAATVRESRRAALNLMEDALDSRCRAEALNAELQHEISSQEQERARLARDLHDEFGQNLTACRLLLTQLTGGEASGHAAALQRLDDLTNQMAKDLHRVSIGLRPTALDDLGLATVLEGYLGEWSSMTNIPVSVHIGELSRRLPSETATAVYRIIQEALTNVAKHARAQTVSVIVEQKDGTLSAIVEDDGVGFDLEASAASPRGSGLGLRGMHERAVLTHGELQIESAPGQGTSVYLRINVEAA
jgi:signal transduction histidine kinase